VSVRVLVVDDDEDIRLVIQNVLAWGCGAKVDVAGLAQEALELIRSGRTYDVVLADERMPGMTGSMLLMMLGQEGFPGRRLLMSAYGHEFLPEQAWRQAGIDGFLAKPVAVDDLLRAVGGAVPAKA